jgi:RNase adapter protein RapZ
MKVDEQAAKQDQPGPRSEPPGGEAASDRMQLILVTGMSGSGKSVALKVLEDSGYYCVDNLPAHLLPGLADFLGSASYTRVAVSVDVRSGHTLEELPAWVAELGRRSIDLRVLFLDAKTDTLVKRFSETRRRHPLSDDTRTLPECIEAERELLADISALAHHVDTSELSPHALRAWVKDFVDLSASGLTVLFQSFAFKNGVPLDADLVFDVRCLPNPHYDPLLRPMTGLDQPVVEFLRCDPSVQKMLADIWHFLDEWLPCYIRDNRSYLTVGIGCTGGRHRSVYLTEELAQRFRARVPVLVRHREMVSA